MPERAFTRIAILLLASSWLLPAAARAELSRSQARNVIRKMAGADLPGSAVRVKSVSAAADGTTEVTADLKTVFRFQQNKEGRWRVAELRIGQDRWLRIDDVAQALNANASGDDCQAPDLFAERQSDPSVKRARCLVASLLGVTLPSDEVRIQQVSPLGVPFVTEPSAIVEALVEVKARLTNEPRRGWRVTEVRTGRHGWVLLDSLVASIESQKQKQTLAELQIIATALEQYRRDRGAYVVSDSQAVLIDHISPKYLVSVLRLDPWNQPYQYQGDRDRFTLSSSGPDRKTKTADDITLSH
jgi:Type II secretion system (T2SS), protein G